MTDGPMAFEPPQDWFGSRYEIIRPLNPSEELRKAFVFEGSAPQ